jgi:Fe-S cluster assembly ATP-binding protein
MSLKGIRRILQGRPVLDELDLKLTSVEIHDLLGANGAGKSYLAYSIMGCEDYRPDSGVCNGERD